MVPAAPLIPSDFLTTILSVTVEDASESIDCFEPAPAVLPKFWQFSYRTALPPRAPSFIS